MSALFKNPWYQPLSSSLGNYPGAKLNFYKTGTSTQQDTYSDGDLTTTNANPVVADAGGIFAPIYLDQSLSDYKVILTDADDNTLQTVDPYRPGDSDFLQVDAVADLSALQAVVPPTSGSAVISMAGRSSNADGGEGEFSWDGSDLSTEVTNDNLAGIYVAPDSDSTGSSGAWVRKDAHIARPRWYGADGSGTTDDTNAVQAALNSGLSVQCRHGDIHLLSSGLDITTATKIVFDLNGAVLKTSVADDILTLYYDGHTIINGTFDGNNLNGAFFGINVQPSATGVIIKNNKFQDIGASAVYLSAADRASIIDNKIDNCGTAAASSNPFTFSIYTYDSENIVIKGNIITNGVDGIHARGNAAISKGVGMIVRDNIIGPLSSAASYGIYGLYMESGLIDGNTVDGGGNAINGIRVSNSNYTKVSNNYVLNIDQHGIYLLTTDLCKVNDNVIYLADYSDTETYVGIYHAADATRSMIDQNEVIENAAYIVEVAGGNDTAVRFNRGFNLITGTVNDSGTTTVSTDNLNLT